jgi:hypothetical protein
VEPTELVEVISLTPEIVPRCRSSGVATLLAMVSGLAPVIYLGFDRLGGGASRHRADIGADAEAAAGAAATEQGA